MATFYLSRDKETLLLDLEGDLSTKDLASKLKELGWGDFSGSVYNTYNAIKKSQEKKDIAELNQRNPCWRAKWIDGVFGFSGNVGSCKNKNEYVFRILCHNNGESLALFNRERYAGEAKPFSILEDYLRENIPYIFEEK